MVLARRVLLESVHMLLHLVSVAGHGLVLHLSLDVLRVRVLHHVHGAVDRVGRHARHLPLHLLHLLRSLRRLEAVWKQSACVRVSAEAPPRR